MISLAASSTSTRISPETGETRPAGDAGRADGGFSAVLAQLGTEQIEPKSGNPEAPRADGKCEIVPGLEGFSVVLVGTELPEAAECGKELPVVLPVSLPVSLPAVAGEADADSPTTEPASEADMIATVPGTIEMALTALAMPQVLLPGAAVTAPVDETAQPGNPASKRLSILHPAIPAQVPAPVAGESKAVASAPRDGAPETTAVTLQVGPQPIAPAARGSGAATDAEAESGASAPKPREAALDRPVARSILVETARPAELLSAAAPIQSSSAPAAPASASVQPSVQTDALHELTRIVDRLAAAREVFAPAAEALAIEHAEFGELSLRFDQRRDGGLSVQLSASNPDAHRAVAQAVGAQPFQSTAEDRAGSGQPQGQALAHARGGLADRGGASGNGDAARHEQQAPQQQSRSRPSHQQQEHAAQRRAGVFA